MFVGIDQTVGERAAELRARYNLKLPDALQAAVALESGCDAILTNHDAFRRVVELSAILVDELTV